MHTRCPELQQECVLFIVVVYSSKFSLLSDSLLLRLSWEKFHRQQCLVKSHKEVRRSSSHLYL